MNLSLIDMIIIGNLVLYFVWSGGGARCVSSKSLEKYFFARSLPDWNAGMSMTATLFTADTPLLLIGSKALGVFLL